MRMKQPTRNDINDALASIARAEGKPLIEETIGPAEVQYMHVRLDAWRREQDAIDQLKGELNAERELCMAVMRVSAEKDEELDALEADRDWWRRFGLVGVAVATIAGTVAVVLAAKIAGWL